MRNEARGGHADGKAEVGGVGEDRIMNKEQGILNIEVKYKYRNLIYFNIQYSIFLVPCSIFKCI